MLIVVLYLLCGAAAGFFSGLLGIGGGLVVVPLLTFIFTVQGVMSPDVAMHVAVATSLSSILFTSVSSARSHARRGSVEWRFVRGLAPGIVAGTLIGSFGAAYIPGFGLRAFFVVFFGVHRHPDAAGPVPQIPGLCARRVRPGRGGPDHRRSVQPGGAGRRQSDRALSALVRRGYAQGGRHLLAVAWPIAVAGTFGFVVSGWGNPLLPAWSLGYVSLPATLGIACTSVFFAPLGARLAHALPVPTLRKVFAVFLYVTAVDMMWGMLH